MKKWQIGLLAVVLFGASLATYVFIEVRKIEVEQLSDDLFILRGMGGNTAVLRTDEGAVVVDTMTLPMQGEQIRQRARELTGSDTVMLINSHYHLDHTHGNPAFLPGIAVLATDRTLSHLLALDGEFWQGEAAQLLPNEVMAERKIVRIGGKTMILAHPGRGHTDGDLVVLFVDEKVIHMGDLHFNQLYPNIDLEAGGSVAEWPATLEQVLTMDFERVIPGHGATSDRDGVRQFQSFMAQLAAIGANAALNEISLEDTVDSTDLTADASYQEVRFFISLGLDRAFVLRRAWEEATGNFERLN